MTTPQARRERAADDTASKVLTDLEVRGIHTNPPGRWLEVKAEIVTALITFAAQEAEQQCRYPDDPARSVAAMLSRMSPEDKQAFNFCVKAATAQAEQARAQARREEPKVGVTALVVEGDRVLLGLKGRAFDSAFIGKWVTPGGRVAFGEPLETALVREVFEETGLIVTIRRRLPSQELIHPAGHFVFFAYEACWASGVLKAGDDLSEVRWFSREELGHLSMTSITRSVIDSAALRAAPPPEGASNG